MKVEVSFEEKDAKTMEEAIKQFSEKLLEFDLLEAFSDEDRLSIEYKDGVISVDTEEDE